MRNALISAPLIDSNTFFVEGTGTIVEDIYDGGRLNSYTNYGLEDLQITNHNFPRSDLYVGNLYFCTYAFDLPSSLITISNCTNYNVGDCIPMIANLTVTIDNIINVPWTQDFIDEMMFYGKGGTQIRTEYQQGLFAKRIEPSSGPIVGPTIPSEVVTLSDNNNGFSAEIINYLKSNIGKSAKFRIDIKTVPTIRLLINYTPINGRYIGVTCSEYSGCEWTEYCDEFNPITVALPVNQQCTVSCYMRADDYNISYETIEFPITLTEDLTTKTINFVQKS